MKSKPRRLLIIDDEAAVRRFLRLGLEPKGYLIEETTCGKEGLERAASFVPDIVILDLGLPDMDGIEVLRRIREWSKVPVVVLTVRDLDTEKVALLEAGADDYVTKPFSLIELVARLQVAERHSEGQSSNDPVFKSDRLEIDFSQHAVKLDGKAVKLTATEYNLLRILALNGGKVVTQAKLREEVWGNIGMEAVQYLRVYVGLLRKKLEDDPSQPRLILTEPNVGYRLAVGAITQ